MTPTRPALRLLRSPLAAWLAVALSAAPSAAQGSPLSLRASAGGSIPTGAFDEPGAAGGGTAAGASFGVHFDYRARPHASVYLGFSQHRFACDGVGCPGDGLYVHTGWDVGARWVLSTGRLRPWAEVGAVFARVEGTFPAAGDDRVRRAVSDLSVGVEAGGGVTVPVRGRLGLEPAARWVWLNTRFPGEGLLRVRAVVVDLGVVFGF